MYHWKGKFYKLCFSFIQKENFTEIQWFVFMKKHEIF